MSSWEAWKRHRDNTEVVESNGKYHLKGMPDIIYGTYEEAQEKSEFLRSIIAF